MAKNKLTDMNDHLFAALERLGEEDLTDEELAREVKRAESMVKVASVVLESGSLALRAAELRAEYQPSREGVELPPLLAGPAS